MFILYSLALACAVMLSLPWWILQMLRHGKYRAGLAERMGRVPFRLNPQTKHGCVWIHAVSVGEVLAVSSLVRELESAYPGLPVVLSTTTLTGQQLARQRFGADRVFYLPLDFGFAVRSYLRALRPRLLVLAETEFWPNLLHLAKSSGTHVAIVNARISDRSFPRYMRFRRLFSPVLGEVDLFLAQTEEDQRRLQRIGASAGRVRVSGNLKFDTRISQVSPLTNQWRLAVKECFPVIVCGSTAEGEEELLLNAFQEMLKRYPAAMMILAPRHPERFEQVAGMVTAQAMRLIRRSSWTSDCSLCGCVFLLDSVGDLASVYSLANIAFVGGSLVPAGGHNILEPAQHGVAVMTGQHTFNFREIVRIFEQGGGLKVVSPETLVKELAHLTEDRAAREEFGRRAKSLFQEHTGATIRTLLALQPYVASGHEKAQG